ncbi:TonB-dependent receptor [Rheinheimera mesophila]|uniref:TonB-dependent receptor n=1 Tax=Rheinheimera mesophila TaxID=1547515 RepID=A0A3P3QJ85_9GAMM|nr:TonB-dependent receptor [Rheinheimera mesophila]KKL01328.1 TonB-dependent receptor [Rheinheimera mesophila]RRJ21211.1 TonB-dependent receptor [Rheinheimera mesophila]
MSRKTLLASLIAASLSGPLWAQSVQGVVVDEQGQPVADAWLTVVGQNKKVKTDASGRFELTDLQSKQAELHIEASSFTHRNFRLDLPEQGLQGIRLVLNSTALEVIDVKASPFHASATESALPVSVLAGERLKMSQQSTLGDTLKNEVGVHSNFYGSVASSPIIRGLDGPRVLITQNGLDAGDASRIGPDHSVSAEASTASQIEVLRGPATLFYGSGAIGGVVNVVDNRVPTEQVTKGEWMLQRESVNNEKLASGSAQTFIGQTGVYADVFWRDNDDYSIPGQAEIHHDDDEEHEESASGKVANTAATAKGFSLGSSYLLQNGFVGLSFGQLKREYGIPGHSHGGHAHEGEEATEESVYADLKQDRVQLLSEMELGLPWLQQFNSRIAYTDYQHMEIEEGLVGTTFKNQSEEARFELLHPVIADWRGGISLHYKHSDFEAVGDEAFTPPSSSEMLAIALMEERHFGPVLLQLGARTERVTINASDVLLPQLSAHSHDEGAAEHDHDHDADFIRVFDVAHKFKPYSLSAGAVWDFTEGYNLGLSLSRSERAPSASELLSFGPHIGTGSYEVGALFSLNTDPAAEQAIVLNRQPIEMEVANNLDLTLRKISGDIGLVVNAFYNKVDNYYYQQNTGLFAEDGHNHNHGNEEGHDHSGELPVYLFVAEDVILHGFESQLAWQIAQPYRFTVQADYIRARLDSGGDLPRTPPLRLSSELAYEGEQISADLRLTRYFKQDKVSELESATAGYSLLDASVSYHLSGSLQDIVLYVKGENLTDEEARVHTSFLKDKTPLPGRSLGLGIRGQF